ncbi:MAG: hypothetical protein QOC89_3917 [Paraburkholderia sp.]|nr:hypothetical protein [Paraburkholderia sp.]
MNDVLDGAAALVAGVVAVAASALVSSHGEIRRAIYPEAS